MGVEGVWSGTADWDDGGALEVVKGTPEGAEGPVVGESRSQFSPDYAPEEIYEIAAKMMAKGGVSEDDLLPNEQTSRSKTSKPTTKSKR